MIRASCRSVVKGSGNPGSPKVKMHVSERLWHCLLYVGSMMKQATIGSTETLPTLAANGAPGSARAGSRLSTRASEKGLMQASHETDRCWHMHGWHHVLPVFGSAWYASRQHTAGMARLVGARW